MCGGKVRRPAREWFRTARKTATAASAGQKILFSARLSDMLWRGDIKMNNGMITEAKRHAAMGTIPYMSIMGVEGLGQPNSTEFVEALTICHLMSVSSLLSPALNAGGTDFSWRFRVDQIRPKSVDHLRSTGEHGSWRRDNQQAASDPCCSTVIG